MSAKAQQYPNGVESDNANWTLTGAATKYEAIDDDNTAADDDTSYIQSAVSNSVIRFDVGAGPSATTINSLTVFCRVALLQGSLSPRIRFGVRVGGLNYFGDWIGRAGNDYGTESQVFGQNPNTVAQWLDSELGALILIMESDNNNGSSVTRVTQLYAEVDYVATPAKIGAVRVVGSLHTRLRRLALPTWRARL
jgi:hypothetical protein